MLRIILQPTGESTKEDFIREGWASWAEDEKYRKTWEESVGDTVLFTKDNEIFAIATIEALAEDFKTSKGYPLRYIWNNNISYVSIPLSDFNEAVGFKSNYAPRGYRTLKDEQTDDAMAFLNTLSSFIYDENNDESYQDDVQNARSKISEDRAELKKDLVEVGGSQHYPRSPSVAKYALELAHYKCELNENHNTFISRVSNSNYVEAHHLVPLRVSEESFINFDLDVPANIISLCPTCHRMMHNGTVNDINEAIEKLYNKRSGRLKKVGLDITSDELKSIYKSDLQ